MASDDGYTLRHVRFEPRLGLKANVTSGDRNPSDPNLQTFNALFPKGAYFGQIGPANHIDLQPSIDFKLAKKWTMKLESGFFWRQSIHDGIYGPALNLLRSAGSSQSRYVGSQVETEVHYQVNRHFIWAVNYTHFFAGQFLADTGPAKDVNYCTTWIAFRF